MTTMTYKSYEAIVEFDEGADIFHGEVINLRDVVTFQGRSVDELKRAFSESVDDYLAFCKARGEVPEKPFSGQFVVRAEASLHKPMSAAFTVRLDDATAGTLDRLAQKTGRSPDSLVAEAVQDYLALNTWQLEKIESGIAAAERGDFATVDEISRVRAKFLPQP